MKKALLLTLVVSAVAGVILYLNDPESFTDTIDELKDKAGDEYEKVKKGLGKSKNDLEEAAR